MEYDDYMRVTNPTIRRVPPVSTRSDRGYRDDSAVAPVDFDEASAAWMRNKVRKGAVYVYRCPVIAPGLKGVMQRCGNTPCKREGGDGLCLTHFRLLQSPPPSESHSGSVTVRGVVGRDRRTRTPRVPGYVSSTTTQTGEPSAHR